MKNIIFPPILLSLAFAVLVSGKPPRPPIPPFQDQAVDTCYEEMGITEEDYREAEKNGEYVKEDCLAACMGKRIGLFAKDGRIDKEVAKLNFPPYVSEDNATKIIDACSEQKGKNACETAVLYRNCFMKLTPRRPIYREIETLKNECRDELSLTDEDIKELEDSKGADEKANCFIHCMGTKSGFLNEDGTINKERLMIRLPPHMLERMGTIIDKCAKEEVGANKCKTGSLVAKCLVNNNVEGHPFGPFHH